MAYTLLDPFPSLTTVEVLALYKALQQEKAKGKTIISTGAGDVSAQLAIQQSIAQRESEFQRSLYAKDPVNYAAYADCGQNVTHVAFS